MLHLRLRWLSRLTQLGVAPDPDARILKLMH